MALPRPSSLQRRHLSPGQRSFHDAHPTRALHLVPPRARHRASSRSAVLPSAVAQPLRKDLCRSASVERAAGRGTGGAVRRRGSFVRRAALFRPAPRTPFLTRLRRKGRRRHPLPLPLRRSSTSPRLCQTRPNETHSGAVTAVLEVFITPRRAQRPRRRRAFTAGSRLRGDGASPRWRGGHRGRREAEVDPPEMGAARAGCAPAGRARAM